MPLGRTEVNSWKAEATQQQGGANWLLHTEKDAQSQNPTQSGIHSTPSQRNAMANHFFHAANATLSAKSRLLLPFEIEAKSGTRTPALPSTMCSTVRSVMSFLVWATWTISSTTCGMVSDFSTRPSAWDG